MTLKTRRDHTTASRRFDTERRSALGGTDAAAILGISPWKTRHDVWLEKRELDEPISIIGKVSNPGTEQMGWGLRLEKPVRDEYNRLTGRAMKKPPWKRHRVLKFMAGHADGWDGERGLEVKIARSRSGWGEPGTGQIPLHYKAQVTHYMAVWDAQVWDVAVLFGGDSMAIYTVERDDVAVALLVDEEREFWLNHVLLGVPPDPDGSAAAGRMVRALYPIDRSGEMVALPHHSPIIDEYLWARDAEKKMATHRAMLEQAIQSAMGDYTRLVSEDVTINWSTVKPGVNWKAVAEAYEALLREDAFIVDAEGVIERTHDANRHEPYRRFSVRLKAPYRKEITRD